MIREATEINSKLSNNILFVLLMNNPTNINKLILENA